jgi:hypothetical protein
VVLGPVVLKDLLHIVRPMPWPDGFVVKNGVNSCSRTSSGMPGPVSAMTKRTRTSPGDATHARPDRRRSCCCRIIAIHKLNDQCQF